MACSLSWQIPQQVLNLTLDGHPTYGELETINREVIDILNQQPGKVNILIDTVKLQTGYKTAADLRDTQKYMDHSRLLWAVVVADNKLNRLITLMAFCVTRAQFVQVESFQQAETFYKRHLSTNN